MKPEKFFEAIGSVDEKFIEEAAQYKMKKQGGGWFLRLSAAACFLAVLGVSAWAVLFMEYEQGQSPATSTDAPYSSAANGLPNGTQNGASLLVADFIGEYTTIFSLGLLTDDLTFTDIHGSPLFRNPLIYWSGRGLFYTYGNVINDAPFLIRDANVAADFFLYDLGEDVPVVVFEFPSLSGDLNTMYMIYYFSNGEFIPMPGLWRNLLGIEDESIMPFWWNNTWGFPQFFTCDDGRIIMHYNMQSPGHSNLFHVSLEGGSFEIIEELPARTEINLTDVRMYDLENSIRILMEQRFTAYEEREMQMLERDIRDGERRTLEEEARMIVYDMAGRYNDLMRIFRGLDANGTGIEHEGRRYAVVNDRNMPHIRSLQDIIDAIDFVFTRNGGGIYYRMLLSEQPPYFEIDGVLVRDVFTTAPNESFTPIIIDDTNLEILGHWGSAFSARINISREMVRRAAQEQGLNVFLPDNDYIMYLVFILTEQGYWRISEIEIEFYDNTYELGGDALAPWDDFVPDIYDFAPPIIQIESYYWERDGNIFG
jgi:hypothetical protein